MVAFCDLWSSFQAHFCSKSKPLNWLLCKSTNYTTNFFFFGFHTTSLAIHALFWIVSHETKHASRNRSKSFGAHKIVSPAWHIHCKYSILQLAMVPLCIATKITSTIIKIITTTKHNMFLAEWKCRWSWSAASMKVSAFSRWKRLALRLCPELNHAEIFLQWCHFH